MQRSARHRSAPVVILWFESTAQGDGKGQGWGGRRCGGWRAWADGGGGGILGERKKQVAAVFPPVIPGSQAEGVAGRFEADGRPWGTAPGAAGVQTQVWAQGPLGAASPPHAQRCTTLSCWGR